MTCQADKRTDKLFLVFGPTRQTPLCGDVRFRNNECLGFRVEASSCMLEFGP